MSFWWKKKSCVKLKSFTVLLSTIALPVFYLQAKSAVLSGSSHSPPLVLCCSGTSAMTQWKNGFSEKPSRSKSAHQIYRDPSRIGGNWGKKMGLRALIVLILHGTSLGDCDVVCIFQTFSQLLWAHKNLIFKKILILYWDQLVDYTNVQCENYTQCQNQELNLFL